MGRGLQNGGGAAAVAFALRRLAACLLLAVLPATARAQADESDAPTGAEASGAATGELSVQAAATPPQTGDRHELAVFYHKRGVANDRLGNYARAIEDLRLALGHSQAGKATPDEWGERWRIQNDLGSAYERRGDWFARIDLWKGTAAEYQKDNPYQYHFSLLQLMRAYGALGQRTAADGARQDAEAALERLRSVPSFPRIGSNALDRHNFHTANFYYQQGNYAEAEKRFRASLDWAGKYVEAMRAVFPEGHQKIRIAVINVGTVRRALAEILASQGKYGEAEVLARAGLRDALAYFGPDTNTMSYALGVLAWTRFQQGDLSGAEAYRREALAAVERSGVLPHSTALAARRAALANVFLVQGRWNEALRLYEVRDEGLRSDAAQFKRYGSNLVEWSYALHKTGQAQRAADMARRLVASQVKRAVPNEWALAHRRGVLAMALAATGKTGDALKVFQAAVPDLIRRDQSDATAENTGFWRAFWQRAILEAYLDLLAKLHAKGEAVPGLDLADESFRIADIARGSTVQEAIAATAARAQLPDRSLAELARREQDALNRVVALNQLLARLASALDQERVSKVVGDVRVEIESLRREHAAARAEIRKRYPEYAELIDPRPAGIADVRKALAPGEGLVAIYLGESQAYAWTVGSGGKSMFRAVPVSRATIESDVRALRRAMELGDGSAARLRPFDLARAHNLYRAIFEADEGLWKEAQVLNVIPHGALAELPFAVLVATAPGAGGEAAYRDAHWLIRKVAIAQLPSASAFAALRRAPPGKAQRQAFIGFGDPLFAANAAAPAGGVRSLVVRKIAAEEQLKMALRSGESGAGALSQAFALLSPLPDTAGELRDIAAALKADPARDVFVSRQATEKNVKQGALENRRVVAFATHGIAPGEVTGLDQPALVLSNPALAGDADNDGFLTMEEVLALKLDADWVVLSACNTASADGRGSEAVSGLGRAFFYAGARSLLVSNWAVETTSARLLTTELFKRQAENPKLTRAEALRQSMLDLIGKNAPGGFSYAHPAFWAPFSLVGDGGR